MVKKNLEDKEKLQNFKEDIEYLEWYIKEINLFIPIAVCGTTAIGIITFVNRALQELIGRKEIDIIGQPIENLFLEKEKIREIIAEIAREKTTESGELTLISISKTKKEILVKIDIAARQDNEGNLIGYFIALTDITESRKFREELEKKVQKRAGQLQKKIGELERLTTLIINRELGMIGLKKEIKRLKEEINKAKQIPVNLIS